MEEMLLGELIGEKEDIDVMTMPVKSIAPRKSAMMHM
jgi:hypothetical protein